MANMSYCRFENTARDLEDCYDAIDDTDDLCDREARFRKYLIDRCRSIASEYPEGSE